MKKAEGETSVENMLRTKVDEVSKRRESWECLNAMNVENMWIIKLYGESRIRESWEFLNVADVESRLEKWMTL